MTREIDDLGQQFASDNYAGICPEAWAAMERANRGHATAYGDDVWTARAANEFRELFEAECEVFFVFNGTAANSLALASLCQSYHGVICCDASHVETDECGAPEFFSNGSKLLVAQGIDGKLTPASIHELATKRQDIHYPKPRVVTITQPTETGRVYTLDEVKAISAACKE
ncbi:MAG TPA: beta-eliminating lyase-related protein, partial [Terracidiphilus sp.]|nr:beta-eliminating lyase-related protein [Terracidiphilus sp.]